MLCLVLTMLASMAMWSAGYACAMAILWSIMHTIVWRLKLLSTSWGMWHMHMYVIAHCKHEEFEWQKWSMCLHLLYEPLFMCKLKLQHGRWHCGKLYWLWRSEPSEQLKSFLVCRTWRKQLPKTLMTAAARDLARSPRSSSAWCLVQAGCSA